MLKVRDNHRLHFRVHRGGEPTILLESGGGADASQWNVIQERLASETGTTIISYDRAGFGSSDLPDSEYDIRVEAQDLHTALTMLGTRNLILVSHSYGAILSQAYQHLYPDSFQAIILLDPNTAEFVDSVGVENLTRISFDTTGEMTKRQKADLRQTRAFKSTIDYVRNVPYSKDARLIVVTAGVDWWPFAQVNSWWHASQKNLASSVPGSKFIVAEGSAHNIPELKPELVIDLVREQLGEQ